MFLRMHLNKVVMIRSQYDNNVNKNVRAHLQKKEVH